MAPDDDAAAADADARDDVHERAPRADPSPGDMTVDHVDRDGLRSRVEQLYDDGFVVCLDVCGVDYLTHPGRTLPDGVEPERFEVVVTLMSHQRRERRRLRVQVPEDDPEVPSIVAIHPGAEAMEREAYDMVGIGFADHPDPTRILMPEDWEGHPLRKDYAVGAIPVQFKAAGSQP